MGRGGAGEDLRGRAMMMSIFLLASAVLVVVPLVFVMHEVYEDGVVGRSGLLVISFVSAVDLLEWFFGEEYEVLPQTTVKCAAFAVFLCWHLFRFHRRVLRRAIDEISKPWRAAP